MTLSGSTSGSLHVWPVLVAEINVPSGGNNIANIVLAPQNQNVRQWCSLYKQWPRKYIDKGRSATEILSGATMGIAGDIWMNRKMFVLKKLHPLKYSSEILNDFFMVMETQRFYSLNSSGRQSHLRLYSKLWVKTKLRKLQSSRVTKCKAETKPVGQNEWWRLLMKQGIPFIKTMFVEQR